jgi:hypothetical protein
MVQEKEYKTIVGHGSWEELYVKQVWVSQTIKFCYEY